MTATRPRIPTAALYREVTATRLAGFFFALSREEVGMRENLTRTRAELDCALAAP